MLDTLFKIIAIIALPVMAVVIVTGFMGEYKK